MANEYKLNHSASEISAKLDMIPSLGITDASVGDNVVVAAVDENGSPTSFAGGVSGI